MITVQDLAKVKQKTHLVPAASERQGGYDHITQRAWHSIDQDTFKISMKSDTAFDRESDPHDEK